MSGDKTVNVNDEKEFKNNSSDKCVGNENITKEEYNQYVENITPSFSLWKNMLKAFITGGLICLMGQVWIELFKYFGMDKEQAENLRKMFLAMAKDIRVILIKLADRLHNMRTLQYMKPEKQKEKSRETMDIYSPIADRLGISKIKIELDDLALRYLEPEKYREIVDGVHERLEHREDFMNDLIAQVKTYIEKAGIKATIGGRVKHYFSIYKKMVNQQKTLDQIYDVFAVRIIVDTVMECYGALGVIHEKYTPVPGRFKDYIAMPKPNMYQSLHTTLIGPNGQPFEIQIRTYDMHRTAEYGIAAHWKYKENITGEYNEEQKISWLRQILEWQRDLSDNREFLSLLKDDLNMFSDSVYCFTPNGDVKNLPAGSTPIDFAYSIHSAVGNKMVGARANGKMVNIDYKIQNVDRVPGRWGGLQVFVRRKTGRTICFDEVLLL